MLTKLRFLLMLLFQVVLFSSCSFNKLFLQPTVIPARTTQLMYKSSGEDSILVQFSEASHQPVFLQNRTDTIAFDFSIESVLYKSANGNQLNGWLMKPLDTVVHHTIIHLHGNSGSIISQFKAIAPLVKQGFQVFTFDYSGFGFSAGKPTRNNVLIDALSTLDYIKTRTDINTTAVYLYGQSLGGHLSAVVAAERPGDISGLIAEGAFSSHKDIGGHMVKVLGKIFVKQGYSAVKSIKEFHKPVLIIHSTQDEVVPFEMGKKIYDAANLPKEFYEVQKCHICAPQYYAKEIAEKIKNMEIAK